MGDDIYDMVLDFLNHGIMPKGLNHTNVVLFPNALNPSEMKDLSPISLCNVFYKLNSMVLANKLEVILSLIIDDNQSAFVQGRLIYDNILLSSEVFHFLQHNQARKRGYMAFKLDMSKAYDRVEWEFLSYIMTKIGFPSRWINYVSSVTYSFLVNGVLFDIVVPKRRLCQGDPISPYLFLLCVEDLGTMINKALRDKSIHGITIAYFALKVSHLFFLLMAA